MPVGAMRQIRKTESGGRPGIVVADMVTGASELGGYQLVVEHDAAGNPDASSNGGAIGADVDPLDRWGAYYGAQWVYAAAKRRFTADLEELGIPVPPDTDVEMWIVLMHAQHSIGRSGFKKLLREGKAAGKGTVAAILKFWAEERMPPQINRQSPELVRKRVVRMRGLPAIAKRNAPLPPTILPLVARPSTVPRFDAAKAKRYILAERARGTRARKADGSPPGV